MVFNQKFGIGSLWVIFQNQTPTENSVFQQTYGLVEPVRTLTVPNFERISESKFSKTTRHKLKVNIFKGELSENRCIGLFNFKYLLSSF